MYLLQLAALYAKPIFNYLTFHFKDFFNRETAFGLLAEISKDNILDKQEKQGLIDSVFYFIARSGLKPTIEETEKLLPFPALIHRLISPQKLKCSQQNPPRRTQPDFNASLKKIFNKEKHADLKLVVNKQTTIPIHMCLIAPRWPRFCVLAKRTSEDSNEVHIRTDMPIDSFLFLLWHFYGKKTSREISITHATWILTMSDYYLLSDCENLRPLLKVAKHTVENGVNSRNALEALELAMQINSPEMKQHAMNILAESHSPVELVELLVSVMESKKLAK